MSDKTVEVKNQGSPEVRKGDMYPQRMFSESAFFGEMNLD